MVDIIELEDKTFTKEILDKAVYFHIAEGGAMGEPGCIMFITEDGKVYHANFCFGDISDETLYTSFPVLGKCRFGLFGRNSLVPKGWKYFNLGFGNHLIVRADRSEEFAKAAAKYRTPPELYGNWLETALSLN